MNKTSLRVTASPEGCCCTNKQYSHKKELSFDAGCNRVAGQKEDSTERICSSNNMTKLLRNKTVCVSVDAEQSIYSSSLSSSIESMLADGFQTFIHEVSEVWFSWSCRLHIQRHREDLQTSSFSTGGC